MGAGELAFQAAAVHEVAGELLALKRGQLSRAEHDKTVFDSGLGRASIVERAEPNPEAISVLGVANRLKVRVLILLDLIHP